MTKSKCDGLARSPSAALRFIFRHCSVLPCTPHSSRFARLASGASYCAVYLGDLLHSHRMSNKAQSPNAKRPIHASLAIAPGPSGISIAAGKSSGGQCPPYILRRPAGTGGRVVCRTKCIWSHYLLFAEGAACRTLDPLRWKAGPHLTLSMLRLCTFVEQTILPRPMRSRLEAAPTG